MDRALVSASYSFILLLVRSIIVEMYEKLNFVNVYSCLVKDKINFYFKSASFN
jgi:hypothetical protein